LVVGLALEGATVTRGQEGATPRQVKETSLGQVDPAVFAADKQSFWVSPDGRHVASLTEKGISIDGRAKEYEYGVRPETFSFSPDSQHTAYAARIPHHGVGEVLVFDEQPGEKNYSHIGGGPVFSPDSKHLGFIGRLRASSFDQVPVIDGREGEPAENFNWEVAFTPDSQRMVYAVEIDDEYVIREDSVDGSQPRIEHRHGPAMLHQNFFYGPQGQLGYIAKAGGKQLIVYNGKEDPNRFEEIIRGTLVLSDDGQHYAYLAEPQSFRNVAVYDGKPGKIYKDIVEGSLAISPDGSRWGYAVEDFRDYYIVLDGKEGKRYQGITGPVYSPDSKRVGYLAAANGKVFSVVDGVEGKAYDDRGRPVFSPDGKSAAYWAESGGKRFVVAGGVAQKSYDDVGSPRFSADGSRLVYLAQQGEKWHVVDNGQEGKAYDDLLGSLYFSADNRRLAAIALEGDGQRVVVNGVEGPLYDTIINFDGGTIHFDEGQGLHYVALKGDEVVLVEELGE